MLYWALVFFCRRRYSRDIRFRRNLGGGRQHRADPVFRFPGVVHRRPDPAWTPAAALTHTALTHTALTHTALTHTALTHTALMNPRMAPGRLCFGVAEPIRSTVFFSA